MAQFGPPPKPATAYDDAVPLLPGAAATADGDAEAARAKELLRGAGDSLVVDGVPDVPEVFPRQLAREAVYPPSSNGDGHLAVGYSYNDGGTNLRVMREVDGRVMASLDQDAAWMERFGDTAAWRAADADLGALYSDNGLVFADETGVTPFFSEAHLGKFRAAAGKAFTAVRSSSPYAAIEVCVDKPMGTKAGAPAAKAAGAETGHERGRRGGGNFTAGVVGILAASSAVTGIAADGVISPALGFGFFAVLIAGLSLAMASARGA